MSEIHIPMPLRIAIVDDHQPSIDTVSAHVAKMDNVEVVFASTDPLEGLRFVKNNALEAIFLDIKMGKMDGFEFLAQLSSPPLVVLTTGYKEFALMGFELNVVDFLVKPIPFTRFASAIHKVEDRLFGTARAMSVDTAWDSHILLPVEHKVIQTRYMDIIAVQADRNTTKVYVLGKRHCIDNHTKGIFQEVITLNVNKPFGEMCSELPYPQFVRIHRSSIVALDMIGEDSGGSVKLHHLPDKRFSVSDSYRKILDDLLKRK